MNTDTSYLIHTQSSLTAPVQTTPSQEYANPMEISSSLTSSTPSETQTITENPTPFLDTSIPESVSTFPEARRLTFTRAYRNSGTIHTGSVPVPDKRPVS